MNKLQVLNDPPKKSDWQQFKETLEAKWDKKWEEPSTENAWERKRLSLMQGMIDRYVGENFKKAVDLGAGDGKLAQYLLMKNLEVDAVDISKNALKRIREAKGLNLYHETVPRTDVRAGGTRTPSAAQTLDASAARRCVE